MCGNCLRFARSLKHEELRKDGHGFQEDREGPKDFRELEFIVEDEAEDDARSNEIFHFEGVNCGVVRWSNGKQNDSKRQGRTHKTKLTCT